MLRIKISDINRMLADLQAMPARMETLSRESWEQKRYIASLQEQIKDQRMALEYEIRTDKATYKNNDERVAAIEYKLSQNPIVQKLKKEIDSYDEIREITERQKWQIKDEFTVLKYALRASCAVIEGLSDPIVREAIDDRGQEQF